MRLLYILCLSILGGSLLAQPFRTRFEASGGTQTPAYAEIIDWWQKLDAASGKVKMLTMGPTDAGFPLHLVVIGNNGDSNFESIRRNNKRIILINNGIHPGEPDGIDASMMLARDIVTNRYRLPDQVVLAIIPVYNIGGCLNRSANYRVDQNGPEAFGFRGNSQNLDLNRDMIKCDSREARSLTDIFHRVDPDVFVDNHVSNGADYQHVMTLLTTQHNKLGGVMGDYLQRTFEPALYAGMKQKGYDLIPYVNVWGDTPDKGWSDYWDSPRYASGFAALWHTFSFVPETHMLKPYDQRVQSTKALMECFIEFTALHRDSIRLLREQTKKAVSRADRFPIRWNLDKSVFKEMPFKGFRGGQKPSEVSGLPRLYYDRTQPYEMNVKIYDHFPPTEWVSRPAAYIIPQGWWKVIELLKLNRVQMRALPRDTVMEVEVYRIEDYKTTPRQYEMHHLNSDVKVSSSLQKVAFRKGDWYIPCNQPANRFLAETLEPRGEDSYFAWNFFDAILGQKEGYSAYAFEDIAADYLREQPDIRAKLEERRSRDSVFAKDGRAQLNYVYQLSPWYEPAHNRYPVYRVR